MDHKWFFKLASSLTITIVFLAGCNSLQSQQMFPDSYIDLYVDAVTLEENNEHQKAVEKLNQSLEVNNNFSLAHSMLGQIYQQLNDYDKSAESYEKATQINQWSFQDYFNLGKVYQIVKQFSKAVRAYQRACEIKPDHFQAHINTAKCFYQIEDYNSALVYGQRAEQIDPDAAELQQILGDIYQSKKDHQNAIDYYKRALEADSQNPELMTSLALEYLRTDRLGPAKELLNTAVQIQPDSDEALKYLGFCYLTAYNKSLQNYKNLSTIGQKDTSLENAMNENLENAISSYSKAILINQQNWYAHKGLGVAYILKAKAQKDDDLKQKAVLHWQQSLKIKPDQENRKSLLKYIKMYSK